MTDRSPQAAPAAGHSANPFASPYFLLSFAILLWGGNFVAARLANLDMPPVALSFWRHLLAVAVVAPFIWPQLRRDAFEMRRRWKTLVLMGLLLAGGNTFVYFSVLHTTVINAALINAGLPVAAVFFSWAILRDLINRWQALGILLCFTGIALVVTRADLGVLLGLSFGWGDIFMLAAILCWSLYMVLLKRARLAMSGWSVLVVLAGLSAAWLVPAYGAEIAAGYGTSWTWRTAACLAYVTLLSTVIAWVCWNAGTIRIGPNRASAFMCLHPVFGPILGAIFFAEVLRPYHAVGTVLVLSGVVLVSQALAKRKTA